MLKYTANLTQNLQCICNSSWCGPFDWWCALPRFEL